jgi:hypothetical protein
MNTNDNTNRKKPGIPNRKLRRLAPRFVRVCEKWQGDSPAVRAIAEVGIDAARRFIALYDRFATQRAQRKREFEEDRRAVTALSRSVREWVAVVAPHVDIDPELYVASVDIPDDVVGGAERLLHLVSDEGPLRDQPFAALMIDAITPVLESAQREREEARKLAGDTQETAWGSGPRIVAIRAVREMAVSTAQKACSVVRTAGLPAVETRPTGNRENEAIRKRAVVLSQRGIPWSASRNSA